MDIDISSIRNNLLSISFNLFREWTKNAKKTLLKYGKMKHGHINRG
jgi:hypothetical protein